MIPSPSKAEENDDNSSYAMHGGEGIRWPSVTPYFLL
jgi:hypothetical protein